jgi:hypothetical protein
MLEQLKNISRKYKRALLAALVTLLAVVPGCDKKVHWQGVSTDRPEGSKEALTDAVRGESSNGRPQ